MDLSLIHHGGSIMALSRLAFLAVLAAVLPAAAQAQTTFGLGAGVHGEGGLESNFLSVAPRADSGPHYGATVHANHASLPTRYGKAAFGIDRWASSTIDSLMMGSSTDREWRAAGGRSTWSYAGWGALAGAVAGAGFIWWASQDNDDAALGAVLWVPIGAVAGGLTGALVGALGE
jgi:hypothetical protein